MRSLRLSRTRPADKRSANGDLIRVYRRHAARAISESRWQVAEIFFDRILQIEPAHTEAWLMKGHLRFHCHHDDHGAVHCYRKVIVLCGHDLKHPHARRAQTALGRLLDAAPQPAGAARAG